MKQQDIDFGALKSDAQNVFNQATSTLERIQKALASSSRQTYEQVSSGANDFLKGLDRREPVRFIRRYPVPVTLAAVGLGFLLGAMLSRGQD